MAFAPRRRARRLWSYWRAEQRTLRQGLVALLLSSGAALVAGITLGSITGTLQRLPGLFILIPASVAMRGTIFGAMGARLGTSTHAGLFEVTRARPGVLYQNVFVAVILTITASVYLAALAKGSAVAFGLSSIRLLDLVAISVTSAVLSSTLLLGVTVLLSILSYRRGYDLDAVATPLITAAGDMVSLPLLFLASFLTEVRWLSTTVGVLSLLAALIAVVRATTTDLRLARRVLAESIPVVLLTPVLDILAGTVVEARLDRFAAMPGLLVLIPPLVSNAGALGGILSSRLTSKLQLGVITARGRPEAPAFLDASLVLGFALVIFPLIGALGFGYSELAGRAHPGAGVMVAAALLSGLLATAGAIVVAYYVAVLTTRFGLDPDNHGVPVITSAMDLAGVATFLAVLPLLGVAVHG
jgi:mgtE-like transporter